MTLIDLIENDIDAKKIFGLKEMEIIKKQGLGLKLSQSEKNRLSRDIRPKLNAIKKLSVFKDQFDLKKAFLTKQQINLLKNQIILDKMGNKVKHIYLFGSFLTNKFSENSDIDIAIEFENITKKEASEFKLRIIQNLTDKFDISVLNTLPKNIQAEVVKNGRIIYSNK